MIGRQLGHFRIVAKIGAGGMGEVYRAHDEQLGRDVAIKVLPGSSFRDATARARLLREARTASRLNHPHICTIYEVGEGDPEGASQAYIAMELVEGQPLSERLADGALPPEQVLRYGLQLADGLAHAHERGVVHRDLKSANVIITPEGRAKVLDFGLAKRLSGEEMAEATTVTELTLAGPGMVVGTLAYMAPEQLCGQPADARSDIWALGVVLYEMAAGVRPFQGKTGFELSSAILNQAPLPLPAHLPRGLCRAILRLLSKQPGLRYQSADELRAALEVIQAGGAASRAASRPRTVSPREHKTSRKRVRALAVLPLLNLSRDPEQEYFADGMTEVLIADLAKIRALKVISRTSVMRYKGTDKSLPQIAGELGVDAVIEGSVLRAGERVRITAQLIHAASDTHLWAETYDRDLKDVLLLQSEVARTIAGEIRVAVTPEESSRLRHARTVNPEAYEAYLKGRFHYYRLSQEELNTAERYFNLALEKDPNYALAYVGIADVWMIRGDAGFLPPRETVPKGKAAVLKALELDDALAEAHITLANFRCFEWDWPAAGQEFQRAIQLNPNYAEAHFFYSDFLIMMRRTEEWKAEIQRTLELDPLNFFYQCFYGWHLVFERRYDEAIGQFRRVLAAEPDFSSAHMGLWGAFYRKDVNQEALAEAKKFFAVLGDREVVEALDRGYAEAGYRGAMKLAGEKLAARSERTHVSAVRIARVFAHAEENDRALDWLEKAWERQESPLMHIGVGWDWDGLRSDPRFQNLVRAMKLPL